ncbi:MAG: hypothetical protein KHX03_08835 [Clostridium sp.]|nr:hypothetical protein [Clostridium sp.]
MPIIINTSVSSLVAQNALTRATWNLSTSLERLSTGNRINSAADDPAGSYYAARLNAKIRGSNVAYQNVQAGNNMITAAAGDLESINDQLERIKDLATQYSNDSLTEEQQKAIKKEVQQRVDEINRIAEESDFNDLKLLDGSRGSVRLQIGSESDAATNSLTVDDVFLNASTGQDGIKLFGSGADQFADVEAAFKDADTAAKFIDIVQASADIVTERISNAGIWQSRLSSISDLLMTQNENMASAYSTVMDTDIAAETANYTKNQLLQQTASAMVSQANQISGVLALKLVNAAVG